MNNLWLLHVLLPALLAQTPHKSPGYILGPGDQVLIRALETGDLFEQPVLIGTNGNVTMPLIGQFQAGGLTVEQLEAELNRRLKEFIHEPQAAVTVVEFQSQPVSVFGAVANAGVFQLRGGKSLYEVLSMAGGPRETAGSSLTLTRRSEHGQIPLPGATTDATGKYNSAEVDLQEVLSLRNPLSNIEVRPHDVISVSQSNSRIVYVVGDVQHAGGFTLGGQRTTSVLKALSLAGGLGRTARANRARVLRPLPSQPGPRQIAVNLDRILAGKAEDLELRPGDILVVPTSSRKAFTTLVVPATVAASVAAIIYTTARD